MHIPYTDFDYHGFLVLGLLMVMLIVVEGAAIWRWFQRRK